MPFPLPLPGSEEAFQTIFSPEGPVGVTNPGFFLISWTGREEEKEGEGVHGLLAPAAFTVVLAEPPVAGGDRVLDGGGGGLAGPDVAGEERVYDDDGGGVGLVRLDDLTAAVAALTGASAGLAAAAGFGARAGFLATKSEGEERVRDGDVNGVPPVADFLLLPAAVFFSAEKAGFGRLEEERAGKLSSVLSKGWPLGAVAVEEEEADQALTVSEGAAPATTTGAVPGCWTM